MTKMRDLGASHHGSGEWYWQRISAAILALLLPLVLVLLVSLSRGEIDQFTLLALLDHPASRILHSLLVIALSIHAYLGIRVILEDYVHRPCIRVPLSSAVMVTMFCFALWWFGMIWAA